jgi:hypothetical protein
VCVAIVVVLGQQIDVLVRRRQTFVVVEARVFGEPWIPLVGIARAHVAAPSIGHTVTIVPRKQLA